MLVKFIWDDKWKVKKSGHDMNRIEHVDGYLWEEWGWVLLFQNGIWIYEVKVKASEIGAVTFERVSDPIDVVYFLWPVFPDDEVYFQAC